jgi:hypothetical protein
MIRPYRRGARVLARMPEGTGQIGVNNEAQPERPVAPEWPKMKPAEEAIERSATAATSRRCLFRGRW